MDYLEYTFKNLKPGPEREVLIALLDGAGYEGFVEDDNELKVYLAEDQENESLFQELLEQIPNFPEEIEICQNLIRNKNWNEQWESGFQPIEVNSTVKIRASFHEKDASFKYDLLIDPKMSFGTGHHATTRLMIQAMLKMDFSMKRVLDMGCGTGVLGVLASRMGSKSVLAIDIDEWAYRNSIENVKSNNCTNIEIRQGTVEAAKDKRYDIILANINRNVLLADMMHYSELLECAGLLIISGIILEDREIILEAAACSGFIKETVLTENNWCAIIFNKN